MKKEKVKIIDLSADFKGITFVDGKKCFVENTIAGDIVNIEIVEEKQKYLLGKIIDFVEKSNFRKKDDETKDIKTEDIKTKSSEAESIEIKNNKVKNYEKENYIEENYENENKVEVRNKIDCKANDCKYFGRCGGCPLYFYEENYYYNTKKQKLVYNIKNSGFSVDAENIEIFKVGVGKRRRINIKYNDGVFGFCYENSNNIVKIDDCINLTKNLNNTIKLLANLKFKNLDSIDIFDTSSVVSVNLIFKDEPKISDFKQLDIFKNKNFVVFYTYENKEKYISVMGSADDIKLNLDGFEIILPQNCFLQATQESQDFMVNVIKNELDSLKSVKIADLYCGIGTYSFPLSKIQNKKIYSFEGDFNMVENMKKNIVLNKIKNIFVKQQDLFNQPLSRSELNEFDAVVINPPRNGAENQCKNIVKSKIKKVIYVSCNPQSLARDLKLFYNNFKLIKVFMVDQFYLSKHLESLVVLEKQ